MKWTRAFGLAGAGFAVLLAGGCAGGDSGKSAAVGVRAGTTTLDRVDYGRLVDVYSWDRKEAGQAQKDSAYRKEVLYLRDVVIGPAIATDSDTYLLREIDPVNGRADLVVRWDRNLEAGQFQTALANAEQSAERVAPGRFDQNTSIAPFDVVPRNAALRLTFAANLNLTSDYFLVNPGAIQLLEITGNPDSDPAPAAFRSIPVRILHRGNTVILDPVIVGGEVSAQPGLRSNPYGLPVSPNSKGANIRIAIPVRDTVTGFPINASRDPVALGIDRTGQQSVIRDCRSGNNADSYQGFLFDQIPVRVVGQFQFGILAVDPVANTLTLNKRARLVTLRTGAVGIDARPGDSIVQEVLSPATGEKVRIRAEVDHPGLLDSGVNAVITLRVNTVEGFDSLGNAVRFQASASPLGANCTARVLFEAGKDDPSLFLSFSPETTLQEPTKKVDPFASVLVHFSEPVNPGNLSAFDTLLLTSSNSPTVVRDPKLGTPTLIVSSAVPDPLTAMSVRLLTPLGFNHQSGQEEMVYLMAMSPEKGRALTDLAGNRLDLRSSASEALVAGFSLDKDAETNPVANVVRRFLASDEDGTPNEVANFGPVADAWGQYTQKDGRIIASSTVRFFKDAEESTLRTVFRGDKGECMNNGVSTGGGRMYLTPRNVINVPPVTGGIMEPFNTLGSRVQMTYREDDLGLSNTDSADMEIDVEQMYWASFLGLPINYDVFDRVTLYLAHSERRPDIAAVMAGDPPACSVDGASLNSGLLTDFQANILDGSEKQVVFEDVVYEMNPNRSFKNSQGVLFLPYPKFQNTYTWRDRRLTRWDTANDRVIGLGGISTPGSEVTTNVPNPWYQMNPTVNPPYPLAPPHADSAFRGDVVNGLSPVALPLLMDFLVYPDDPNKNGPATGLNLFFIGVVWDLWPGGLIPHGYYLNPGGAPGLNLPGLRAHTTGGTDSTGKLTLVDPKNTHTATGGWLIDPVLGLHQAPPVDCHIHWARADFLRRVSVITFGFVDLTRPNKNKITGVPTDASPVWDSATYRPVAYQMLTEPALDLVPGGTSAVVEWRGVDELPNDSVYDPAAATVADKRGNLLNPLYACDAYRLASIQGHTFTVDAKGFTNYEVDPQSLVGSTGFGPRYLNWRIVFTNNVTAVPPLSPSLDSMGIAVRLQRKQ